MHSIAFELFGLRVYWYGILTALGFFAGFWFIGRRAPRLGIPAEQVADMAPWLIGGALLGARLWYVGSYWKEEFAGRPWTEVFMINRSGLVFYGGLVGASLATIIYARRRKLHLWTLADVITPSIALGHAFGRIGCLMTGCCYGRECDLPWAIHFPKDHWTHGVGVHPTQIYESLLNLGLFFLLLRFDRNRKFNGQIFALYLLCYALLRSFVEMFRGDYERYYVGGIITPGQLVSVAIFTIGAVLYWWLGRTPLQPPPTLAGEAGAKA